MADVMQRLKAAKRWKKGLAKTTAPMGAKRIAVLGSCALQQLVLLFSYDLYEAGIAATVYEGEYGGIAMDVLDSASPLYAFAPDIVVILPHYTDIKSYPALLATTDEVAALVERTASGYASIYEHIHAELPHAEVLLGNIALPPERVLAGTEQAPYTRTSYLTSGGSPPRRAR